MFVTRSYLNNLTSVSNILKCILIGFLGITAVVSLKASLFICVESRRSNSIAQDTSEIETCQVVLPDGRLARTNLPRRNAMTAVSATGIQETRNYIPTKPSNMTQKDSKDEIIREKDFQKVDLEDFQLKDISSDCSSGYSTEENQTFTIRFSGRLPVSNFGMTQYITKSFYIETFPTTKICQIKIQIAKGSVDSSG